MDQKTFEYMNERTEKYKALRSKKTSLKHTVAQIKPEHEVSFYINGGHVSCTSQMNEAQKSNFKSKLSALIESVVADIDKEMEEF